MGVKVGVLRSEASLRAERKWKLNWERKWELLPMHYAKEAISDEMRCKDKRTHVSRYIKR